MTVRALPPPVPHRVLICATSRYARSPRLGVADDDRGLQGVCAAGSAQFARSPKRPYPPSDLELVPECAVLVHEEDRRAPRVGARGRA
jgi:hypothetical protein